MDTIKVGDKVYLNTAKAGVYRDEEIGLDLNVFDEKNLSAIIPECNESAIARLQKAIDNGLLLTTKKAVDLGESRVNLVFPERDLEKEAENVLQFPQKKVKEILYQETSIEKLKILQNIEIAGKNRKFVLDAIKAQLRKLTDGVALSVDLEEEYQVNNIKEN